MMRKWSVRLSLLVALSGLLLVMIRAMPAGTGVGESAIVSASTGIEPCTPVREFSPSNFSNPTDINNEWLPLVPGTQLVLDGEADRGGGLLPHQVVFTVTDLTKVIDGVRTVVVWDRDLDEGEIQEAELSFFAQDDEGNVWNLGEYPEVFEDGEFIGAPDTWIAGVNEAQAGVHMLADPRGGTSYYLQGYSPDIEFLDCAKVFKTGQRTCVIVGCFDDVLETDEISPLDQGGGHQRKFHAPGVGIVKVDAVGDPEGETLSLSSVVTLSSSELSKARSAALKLEKRAYRVSDVYSQTEKAK